MPRNGARFSRSYAGNLPSSFNTILSSALAYSTCPPVSVSGTVLMPALVPGTLRRPVQSNKPGQRSTFVTHGRLGNINPIPIGYGFRPHLRGRLTLRGLALRRNPWTFGERVSHPLYRYSCQHSHFRYLQQLSRATFTGLRNAPLPLKCQKDRDQGSAANAADDDPTDLSKPCSMQAIRSSPARQACQRAASARSDSPGAPPETAKRRVERSLDLQNA